MPPLGAGAAIPAGTSLYGLNDNSYTTGLIHGYLVPAGYVPAAGSAAAAELQGPPLPKGADKAKMVGAHR